MTMIPGTRNSPDLMHIPPLLCPDENHFDIVYIMLEYTHTIQIMSSGPPLAMKLAAV